MRASAPVVESIWVWRLRWIVSLTHVLVVLFTVLLGGTVQWRLALSVVAVGIASNLGLQFGFADRPVHRHAPTAVLGLDVVLLTGLLLATGAASSPFTFLYLFQVVIGAMVLEPVGVWALVLVGALGYGSLFVLAPVDPHAHHHASTSPMDAHFLGMWIAFGISAPFAAFVVTRVRQALSDATLQVEDARRMQDRTERLTALGTLAAGAAHELATPLSTIMVVAADLRRHSDPEVADDADVIHSQVEQCRDVLSQLAADSGQRIGQRPDTVPAGVLVERIMSGEPSRVSATVATEAEPVVVSVPPDLVAQAIRQLIANALEATDGAVRLVVDVDGDTLKLAVVDEGPGMSEAVLARATEPFFTTKPEGGGMGLGLHFVRSIAEQVGGSLELVSDLRQGTRATLILPARTR